MNPIKDFLGFQRHEFEDPLGEFWRFIVSKSVLVLRSKGVKMIAEKPSWIRYKGMLIFSIDVQPGGLRFATGGGDHKVVFLFLMLLSLCFVYVVFVC